MISLMNAVRLAKNWTARYAENHKGKNALEKECISKGYLVKKYGEVFPDCIESEKNKIGVFALDFNNVHRKGGFVLIR